ANRSAPEREITQFEFGGIDQRAIRARLAGQTAEVADIAAQADVFVEIALQAAAHVEREVVARDVAEEGVRTRNHAAHQTEAADEVGPHAAAVRSAAEQQVAHERRDIQFALKVAELVAAGKEVRRIAEVRFEARDVADEAHASTVDIAVRVSRP